MMELKEFVKKTLTEIKDGVADAQSNGVDISWGYYKPVEFDVSVTTQANEESKAKAGIFVSIAGAGVESNESNNNSSQTRVKFSIDIAFSKRE